MNMMNSSEPDTLTPLIARFLRIDDVTYGDQRSHYLVRFRGQLQVDSAEAYDQLANLLRSRNLTPHFRLEKEQHAIYLVQGVFQHRQPRIWVNAILMALTIVSVFIAGILYTLGSKMPDIQPTGFMELLPYIWASVGGGLAFTASLLGILLAHEFGHYLVGRWHGENVTLPYFLPFPFSPFGTLGAFIQMKEPPKNKRVLLDISLAGPLSGLVVTIPVLILGLSLSKISLLPGDFPGAQAIQLEGNSLLYLLTKLAVFGRLLPEPTSYGNLPVVLYWLRYFFTGQPFPFGGADVQLHPVAWAGWAGLLVTSLNLIPAGQLDGGHMIYVLLGKHAPKLLPFILAGLGLLGVVWNGWWLWAVLIYFLGRQYAEPFDQITTLDPKRKVMAVLGLVIFFLVFTPVPLLSTGF